MSAMSMIMGLRPDQVDTDPRPTASELRLAEAAVAYALTWSVYDTADTEFQAVYREAVSMQVDAMRQAGTPGAQTAPGAGMADGATTIKVLSTTVSTSSEIAQARERDARRARTGTIAPIVAHYLRACGYGPQPIEEYSL